MNLFDLTGKTAVMIGGNSTFGGRYGSRLVWPADILMNCPGKNSVMPFFDISMEEWDSIMEVNLKSVVLACQVFGK